MACISRYGLVGLVGQRLARACSIGATAAAAMLISAASSQAALVIPGACTVGAVSQPFLSWGDGATYVPVPGGDFEGSLTGWTLTGGATVVSDSEPFGVAGSVGSYSLLLPPGAVAVAPPTCVNIPHPTARMFVRTDAPGARLKVQTLYDDGTDNTIAIRATGPRHASADWQPTSALKIHPVVAPALNDQGTAYLTLQFSAKYGAMQIDDVYIDPWGRW
jgi:hypothetical protein